MRLRTYILYTILAAVAAGCASETDNNPNDRNLTDSTDPLRFTIVSEAEAQAAGTRAAQPLTSGFMVTCYKAFGRQDQHTVMSAYNVEYKTTGTAWDGNVRAYWDYTGVSGQHEKYWDYSAFPYRFHGIAPYPKNPSHVQTMSDKTLHIYAPYLMQTSLNGMVTPADAVAEPYMVAQLQRGIDGRDFDLMASQYNDAGHHAISKPREVNTGSQSRNRYVELPFHHLNSKVRFGIYSTAPWTTSIPLYIEGLTVSAYSPDFVTSADRYDINSSASTYTWYIGTGNSGFKNPKKVELPTTHTQLLRFDGGKEVTDNDMTLHQGRASAFWLQCQQGIMQIPQENVQLCVSFRLHRMDNGALYKEFNDIPIQMEDGTRQYNWLSGYIHTYYLIIGGIEDKLEITFTATLTPWEDITGSLTTDLEK